MDSVVNQSTSPQIPGSVELLKITIRYYLAHFKKIASIVALPFIVQACGLLLPILAIFTSVGSIVLNVFAMIILTGLMVGNWDPSLSIKDLYKKASRWFWPFVLVHAYMMLANIGGIFLLVIPGIYAIIALTFVMYVLMGEEKKSIAALVTSWHYVRGSWGSVLWRVVVLGVILAAFGMLLLILQVGPTFGNALLQMENPGSSIPAPEFSPIGALLQTVFNIFIITPFTVIYTSFLYKALRSVKPPLDEQGRQKTERWIKTLMIVGLVGLIAVIGFSIFFIATILPDLIGPGTRSSGSLMQAIKNFLL